MQVKHYFLESYVIIIFKLNFFNLNFRRIFLKSQFIIYPIIVDKTYFYIFLFAFIINFCDCIIEIISIKYILSFLLPCVMIH